MRPTHADRMARVMSLSRPGIDAFYSALTPDMWQWAVDDFEARVDFKNPSQSLILLAALESRRKKMVEIYDAYVALAQMKTPKMDPHYVEFEERTKRELLCCDACGNSTLQAGEIRVTRIGAGRGWAPGGYQSSGFTYVTQCAACQVAGVQGIPPTDVIDPPAPIAGWPA